MFEDFIARYQALPPIAQIGIPVVGVGGVAVIALYKKGSLSSSAASGTVVAGSPTGSSAGGGGGTPSPTPIVNNPTPNPSTGPASPGPTLYGGTVYVAPGVVGPSGSVTGNPYDTSAPSLGNYPSLGVSPINQSMIDASVIAQSNPYVQRITGGTPTPAANDPFPGAAAAGGYSGVMGSGTGDNIVYSIFKNGVDIANVQGTPTTDAVALASQYGVTSFGNASKPGVTIPGA